MNDTRIWIRFDCPKCHSHRLEEVMTGVVVASRIRHVGSDGDMSYGEQSNEGGEVDHYQCMDCGYIIPDVANQEDLFTFLQDIQEQDRRDHKNGLYGDTP